MAKLNAQRITTKWQQKVQGASTDYAQGIRDTDVNPMQAAVAKKDTLKARWNHSIDNGTWEKNLASVPKSVWTENAAGVGAQHYADGAVKGKPKLDRYWAAAAPRLAEIRSEVRAMPNATEADRRARMNRNMELMKTLKGLGRGG